MFALKDHPVPEGSDHGLGHVMRPDPRDAAFPLGAALGEPMPDPLEETVRHELGPITDQGREFSCVGHACALFIRSAPRLTTPGPDPRELYLAAQGIDEFDGEEPAYQGTSLRAGMTALQQMGFLGSEPGGGFRWTRDPLEVWRFILERGPVVLATDWFEGMHAPDANAWARPTGANLGGHCYLAYGVCGPIRALLCANSFGERWGDAGTFRLALSDLTWLLENGGVACSAVEIAT